MSGLYILYSVGGFVVVATFLPFIRSDYWIFRIFEYPRLQKWFITFGIIVLFLPISTFSRWHEWAFLAALLINLSYLSYQIYPFLPIAKKQMQAGDESRAESAFGIIISNVYQYNEQKSKLVDLIHHCKPNLIVLSETDQAWEKSLQEVYDQYPYRVLKPLDNTYGIILLSQLEIVESEIKYLVEDDIPSIFALIKLPSGDLFQLICLHPTPPVPNENVRSTERDKEILIVGRLAKKSPLPVIVSGDLNDVAWSYTNQLFQDTSGLLDPRRGRGFYNTFHAHHRLFRYPLDHVFCSDHFRLLEIERLPDIGSDHFPIWVKLTFEPSGMGEQEAPAATQEEEELADKKIYTPTS